MIRKERCSCPFVVTVIYQMICRGPFSFFLGMFGLRLLRSAVSVERSAGQQKWNEAAGDRSVSLTNHCTVIIQSTIVFGASDLSLSPILDHVSAAIGLRVYKAMILFKSPLTVYTTMNPTRHGDLAIQWWQQTSTKTIATREGFQIHRFSKFVQRLTCRFFYFSTL